jgi:hypothetical protein
MSDRVLPECLSTKQNQRQCNHAGSTKGVHGSPSPSHAQAGAFRQPKDLYVDLVMAAAQSQNTNGRLKGRPFNWMVLTPQ